MPGPIDQNRHAVVMSFVTPSAATVPVLPKIGVYENNGPPKSLLRELCLTA